MGFGAQTERAGCSQALSVFSYLLPWPEQLLNPLTQASALIPLVCPVLMPASWAQGKDVMGKVRGGDHPE